MSYLRPKKTKCNRSWEINDESSAAVSISPQKSRVRGALAEVHAVLHLRLCLHANQPCPARNEGGPGVRAPIFQCSFLTRGTILKKDFTRGLLINIETGCYLSYLPMNASPYWLSFLFWSSYNTLQLLFPKRISQASHPYLNPYCMGCFTGIPICDPSTMAPSTMAEHMCSRSSSSR